MPDNILNNERLPHNIEAEKAVIGCMLQDNSTIEEVFATITSDMFYDGRLRAIFLSIGELRNEGIVADRITSKNRAMPKLEGSMKEKANNIKQKAKELEGYDETSLSDEFFADILSNAAFDTNVMSYCIIVKDMYLLRKAISVASDVIAKCQSREKSAEQICTEAQEEYYKLSSSGATKQYSKAEEYLSPIFEEIREAYKAKNGITGIPTGYKSLDEITAGFQNSDMIVLAGRPGMGKTTFALNLAYNICSKEKKNVLFFSLEMNGIQLVKRIISAQSFVSSSNMRTGKMSSDELRRVVDSAIEISGKKFYISDNSLLTIADLRNRCQKLQTSEGLDIVFIDYLQLMVAGDNYKNSNRNGFMSRQEEIAAISRNIKGLAKDLNVPIIALSQLSRDAEQKKEPQLSDLRESGAIEQDADIVFLINKPKEADNEGSDKTDIIIAKHRNGSTGTINLRFDKSTTRFTEWDNKTEVPSDAR